MPKMIKFTYPCQVDECEGTAFSTMLDLSQADDANVVQVDIDMSISQMELECDQCDARYFTGDLEVLNGADL